MDWDWLRKHGDALVELEGDEPPSAGLPPAFRRRRTLSRRRNFAERVSFAMRSGLRFAEALVKALSDRRKRWFR